MTVRLQRNRRPQRTAAAAAQQQQPNIAEVVRVRRRKEVLYIVALILLCGLLVANDWTVGKSFAVPTTLSIVAEEEEEEAVVVLNTTATATTTTTTTTAVVSANNTSAKRASAVVFNSGYAVNPTERNNSSAVGLTSTTHDGAPAPSSVVSSNRSGDSAPEDSRHDTPSTNGTKKKPRFFAIHMGPSKTGTSAIQEDLCRNPFEDNTLEDDNVIYVGRRPFLDEDGREGFHPTTQKTVRVVDGRSIAPKHENKAYFRAKKCMMEITKEYFGEGEDGDGDGERSVPLEIDETARAALREKFLEDCWKNTAGGDFSYMLERSIIDSDEAYSYLGALPHIGRLLQIIDILGYDRITAVVAYRRYAPWLVSAYHQEVKTNYMFRNLNGERLTEVAKNLGTFLDGHINEKKDRYRYGARNWYGNLDQSLPRLMNAYPSSKVEVKILDFFQQQRPPNPPPPSTTTGDESGDNNNNNNNTTGTTTIYYDSITTEFYCGALGMELVPHTCRHALEKAARRRETADNNNNDNNNTTATNSSNHHNHKRVSNKGSISNVMYQQIVAAGYQLNLLLPTEKEILKREQDRRKCESNDCGKNPSKNCRDFWCESTVQCRKDPGDCQRNVNDLRKQKWRRRLPGEQSESNVTTTLVGTNSTDVPRVYRDLSRYHADKLDESGSGRTWMESLPLRCLSERRLNALLRKSLELEEIVTGSGLYAPPSSPPPPRWGNKTDDHERVFWDVWHGEQKLFCWIDLYRLFVNATSWQDIIDDKMVRHDWPVLYA